MTITLEYDSEMPTCTTCKTQIEFLPYRIVTLEHNSSEIKVLHFHYFAPCWDLDQFFVNHVNDKIVSLAYSYDSEILKKPMILRNIKNNLDLWT